MTLKCLEEKGATMMETLGMLTIISMLGISIIKLVGNALDVFKQNLVTYEVKDLQKSITERFRINGDYKELFEGRDSDDMVSSYLCSSKLAPFQMCSGGKLFNRMGGRVTVTRVLTGDGDVVWDKYNLIFEGLSNRGCMSVAQINWNTERKSSIYKMVINGGTEEEVVVNLPHNNDGTSSEFPIDTATAMRSCVHNKDNTIQWTFN